MGTIRLILDLDSDERARLSAEIRRRGVEPADVVLELVRGLPDPYPRERTLEALARLRQSREEQPPIREEAIDEALAASRADLESRACAGWDPEPVTAPGELPSGLRDSGPS
jgi:hypothetical protein